MCEIITKLLF